MFCLNLICNLFCAIFNRSRRHVNYAAEGGEINMEDDDDGTYSHFIMFT